MKYQHRYGINCCPICGADLHLAGSVMLHAGRGSWSLPSQLDKDGLLLDVDGQIAAGQHTGTSCASCGEHLDDHEEEPTAAQQDMEAVIVVHGAEPPAGGLHFDGRETATILAALRLFQAAPVVPDEIDDIYTNGGDIEEPLSGEEIDALCMKINCG